jgi:hypothetical protein
MTGFKVVKLLYQFSQAEKAQAPATWEQCYKLFTAVVYGFS